MELKAICVFCGSNAGARPSYRAAAKQTGRLLAERQIRLIYGGGNVGLMGALADSAMQAGGEVVGIIPKSLADKELAHHETTSLLVVDSMHQRKAKMAEFADAFIALPGGYGTLEEFCEIITWSQLGFHRKPCGLVNVDGYYDPLLQQFDAGVEEQFIRPEHRQIVVSNADPSELLEMLIHTTPPQLEKWLDKDDT